MVAVGILVSLLLKMVVYNGVQQHPRIYDYLSSIIITIVVWEGNLWIDDWMNRHYPWIGKTRQRILFHLPVTLIYSALSLYLLMLAYNSAVCGLDGIHKKLMQSCLVIGMMISVVILSLEIGGQLLRGWKASLVEVEKYKTESVQAQLKNLKDQVNPHFLFNNLSVLSSLVYKDQDKAVEFIQQLSGVYRYLLDNHGHELVRLETEFRFIDSYIYLLKIRFDERIQFSIDLPPESMHRLIPPMSVQMLIENAIKHNEISAAYPLQICIVAKNDDIIVENNYQPRLEPPDGSGSGLKNICQRYAYFSDRQPSFGLFQQRFKVTLPLLA